MKFTIKQIIVILVVVLSTAIASSMVTSWRNPIILPKSTAQTKIDSTTWVKRSIYLEQKTLLNKLKQDNKQLYKNLKDQKGKIENLTQINGSLKIKSDSLEKKVHKIGLKTTKNGKIQDTTHIYSKNFVDSLLTVTSIVKIQNDSLSNALSLHQNRALKINVAILTDKVGLQKVVVNSPDMKIKYNSITTQKPKKNHWKRNIGIGAVIGMLITLLIK